MHRTDRARRLLLAGGCAALLVGVARSADAQPPRSEGIYVSASASADVKRFSGDPTTNVLDGEGSGGAVAIGSSLAARWDVEVGLDVPRYTENLQPRIVTIRRQQITLQSRTRNRAVSVATLIRYRLAPRGRVQIGYLAGLAYTRLQRTFDTLGPSDTVGALIPRPQETLDYGVAPTVGVDARVAVSARLSIVSAIHLSAFAFREVSGIVLRPRIGVRWTF